jgi:hypothetical protein
MLKGHKIFTKLNRGVKITIFKAAEKVPLRIGAINLKQS